MSRLIKEMIYERGAFICIEGIDKVGKSSIAHKLVESLRKDANVEYLRFPNRETQIGKMIDEYLRGQKHIDDRSIHLLFAANRWELSKQIEKQLRAGVTLIVDRYAFSGAAYSAAKNINLEWCKSADSGLPKPDLVVYLTAPENIIKSRNGFGDEIYERDEFQSEVKSKYELLKDETWKTFVSDKNLEDICGEVSVVVKNTMQSVKRKDIEKLWVKHDTK